MPSTMTVEMCNEEMKQVMAQSLEMYKSGHDQIYRFRGFFGVPANIRFEEWMALLDRVFDEHAPKLVEIFNRYLKDDSINKTRLHAHLEAYVELLSEPPEEVQFFIHLLRGDSLRNQTRMREKLADLAEKAQLTLAPYLYLRPTYPDERQSIVQNNIVGSEIHGSVFQAGGDVMLSNGQWDPQMLLQAVRAALREIEATPNTAAAKDLASDLSTIETQLNKSKVSVPIVQEAGKSLRNLTEGIAAGILTPAASSALNQVLRMLGM